LRMTQRHPALFCPTLPGWGTAVPVRASATLPATTALSAPGSRGPFRLSRFAFVRVISDPVTDGISLGRLVLESPLAAHRVVLEPAALELLPRLTSAGQAGDVTDDTTGTGDFTADERAFVGLLTDLQLSDAGDPPLWEFTDLLFHSRSRFGAADYPVGAHYLHRGISEPLPARKELPGGPPIDLPVPEWPQDAPLSEVLETRRSVRSYDTARPVTLEQLSELLYRAARTKHVQPPIEDGTPYESVEKPYPNGGAAGELEIYLTVESCTGLAPGSYWYDSAAHQLRLVNAERSQWRPLLDAAVGATAGHADPQVLLTVTARFGRMSWKYSAIAYAATLKHVGVLYQTVYLVATAMGLAPCGLGSGDTAASAAVFGLDWTTESAVGELLVGSRREAAVPVTEFRDVVDEYRADLAVPA